MTLDFSTEKPIFQQIAEGIEDAILSGAFPEESQIPSITEFSVTQRINPATANRGIALLVERGIIQKRRGVGMFVSSGAAENLRKERRERFFEGFVTGLVAEAQRLDLSESEVAAMLVRGFRAVHHEDREDE